MVYSSGLENRQAERLREFESHPLRHMYHVGTPGKRKQTGGFISASFVFKDESCLASVIRALEVTCAPVRACCPGLGQSWAISEIGGVS